MVSGFRKEYLTKIRVQKGLFLLTFVVISVIFLSGIRYHSIHIDEHEWLRRSLLLTHHYLIKGDWNNKTRLPFYQYYVHDMPLLTHYVYGISEIIFFQQIPLRILHDSNFNGGLTNETSPGDYYRTNNWWIKYSGEDTTNLRTIPASYMFAYKVLEVGRYVSVFFSLGLLIVMYYIGKMLGGFWVGYLSMVLLAINPLFYLLSRQAMLESIPLFFFMLSFGYYLKIAREPLDSVGELFKKYVILGLLCGCSFAAKLNGLGVYLTIFIMSLLVLWWDLYHLRQGWAAAKKSIIGLGISGMVMIVVFLLINPVFWQRPLWHFGKMLDQLVKTVSQQVDSAGEVAYLDPSKQILGFVKKVWLPRGLATTVSNKLYIGDLTFFGLGLWVMWQKRREQKLNGYFLGLMALWFGMVCLYIRLPQPRYYVPILPWTAVVQAFGILWLLKLIKNVSYKKGFTIQV